MSSYLTLEQANEYHSIRPTSSFWAGLSDDEKMARLVAASDYIDTFRFRGVKTDINQMRQFPRNGSNAIPLAVVYATALLAVSGSLNGFSASSQQNAVSSVKIGELQVNYQSGSSVAWSDDALLSQVKALLADWLLLDKRMGAILVSNL